MPENEFQVIPLRAFKDNYVWTLRNARCAVVVDPGESRPVLDYLAAEKLQLVAILATHHHQDHVGGIAEILETHAVPVYGPRGEPITTLTHPVGGGDKVALPELGLAFEVLDIPGHTRAHIAYYGSNMLFCGDTLFACGCGRVFEGTPQQLYASLAKLAALPDDTLVYCGHEYTLANIGFAKAVEPDNPALLDDRARKSDQPVSAGDAARGHRIREQVSGQARQRSGRSIRCAAPVEEPILNKVTPFEPWCVIRTRGTDRW